MDDSEGRTVRRGRPRRVGQWLLLEGNRIAVGGVVLAGIVVVLLSFAAAGLVPDAPTSPLNFLFSSLLGGNVTLVTVVLSINQLVLARELGSPGELREEIDDAVSYRTTVESLTGRAVSPVEPDEFLYTLHEALGDRVAVLADAADEATDEAVRTRVSELVEWLRADIDRVTESLEREDSAIFAIVAATIETDHAKQLEVLARLRTSAEAALPAEATAALDDVVELVLHIDVARRYFRTVYLQKELAFLSRVLLYVGVPAVLTSIVALSLLGVAAHSTVPPGVIRAGTVLTVTVGLTPLVVLLSFVLRTAYIAQCTASVTPFSAGRDYRP